MKSCQCNYHNSANSVCSDNKLFKGQELVSISEIPDCSALPSLETDNALLTNANIGLYINRFFGSYEGIGYTV